jgi:hypothetical protein
LNGINANLLQDIDNYGMLAKLFFDLQVPTDASYGKFNILAGTRNDLAITLPTIAQANATDPANATYTVADQTSLAKLANELKTAISASRVSCFQINSGELFSGPLAANADTSTTGTTYCLNLFSLLGTLSSQYFPLFACTSAPIRLEIQLVSSGVQCINSLFALQTLKITNCEYVANMIELSDSAMGMIQSSLNGQPLQYVVPDYRNYAFSFANLPQTTQTSIQMPIPSKFSSLKSIICCIRDQGTGVATYYPFSSVKLGIVEYNFRIGSQIMPAKAPNTIPEMFSEVLKAVGSMSDLNHHPSIEKFTYTLDQSQQTTATNNASTSSGSFYIGLDLENYANAPKDSIFAGYNSNTDDIYLVATFASPAAITSVRFDAYAMFDEVLVFENNTVFSRF